MLVAIINLMAHLAIDKLHIDGHGRGTRTTRIDDLW
jgi:hypothetical protein